MKIERFEEIEAWQPAFELTRKVYCRNQHTVRRTEEKNTRWCRLINAQYCRGIRIS